MEFEARRYARRIVLIHLALLIALSFILVWAAGVLYRGARGQAIDQAKLTQELLAKQTALGIENYYESVTNVVDLLQPIADQATTDPSELSDESEARRPNPPRRRVESTPLARFTNGLANSIWFSIRDKASMLLLVDANNEMNIVRTVGVGTDAPPPAEVIAAAKTWLSTVRHRAISPFLRFSDEQGGNAHLLAVPYRNSNGLLIVALIPVARMERDILESVNRSASTGVMLVDEDGTFVSATARAAIGRSIKELDDPRTRALAAKNQAEHFAGTLVFDHEEKMGGVTFPRGMSSIQPFALLGQSWALIISSDLSEIENFIRPVFRNVAMWAICVALAIAALLASTSYRLISSRARLDRMQREAMMREVTEARKIQLNWLPKENQSAGPVQVAAINRPATLVSGDFYNWFPLDDGRFVVVIGDVTGHGMAAAFLMATTQLLVRTIMPQSKSAAECLGQINQQLLHQSFNGQFVTLLILVIDNTRGEMEVATAGHPPPLMLHGDEARMLELEPQYVLGVTDEAQYSSQRFMIEPGHRIVLYTDGVVDAVRPDGERFKTERLEATLRHKLDGAQSIITTLDRALDAFREGRDLTDDLTMVVVAVN